MIATETLAALEHERTPAEALKDGADLACFSGDKLMGGPQASLIAGRAQLVAALKREPFFRALRCDKLILSALEATVDLYLSGDADVPVLEMLRSSLEELRARAEKLVSALAGLPLDVRVGNGQSEIGGGTLPRSSLPSVTLEVRPQGVALSEFAARLRAGKPPVIGYIAGDRFKLDLRTVFPRQDEAVLLALQSIAGDRPS